MTTPPDTPKPLSNLPTEEMIEAGLAQAYPHLTGVQPGDIVRIWQAMVVAAPKSSPQESPRVSQALVDDLNALLDHIDHDKKATLSLSERECIEAALTVLCKLPRMP